MQIIFVRHGETNNNLKPFIFYSDKYNEPINDFGTKQAFITGKYISTLFDNPDIIISSPAKRCLQTAKEIKKSFNSDLKIKKNRLLLEYLAPKELQNKPRDDLYKYIEKNNELIKLNSLIEKEINPFKQINLINEFNQLLDNYIPTEPSKKKFIYKINKFLEKLKKKNYNQVIVITHGLVMNQIEAITTNIFDNKDYNLYYKNLKKNHGYLNRKLLFHSNCIVLGYIIENNVYKLVIPLHNSFLSIIN